MTHPSPETAPVEDRGMSRHSLLGYWYAAGPEDRPFSPDDPAWNLHRVVEDDPASPTVTIENAGGQRFPLDRAFARSIARPPEDRALDDKAPKTKDRRAPGD